jgi:hypothetical protein
VHALERRVRMGLASARLGHFDRGLEGATKTTSSGVQSSTPFLCSSTIWHDAAGTRLAATTRSTGKSQRGELSRKVAARLGAGKKQRGLARRSRSTGLQRVSRRPINAAACILHTSSFSASLPTILALPFPSPFLSPPPPPPPPRRGPNTCLAAPTNQYRRSSSPTLVHGVQQQC